MDGWARIVRSSGTNAGVLVDELFRTSWPDHVLCAGGRCAGVQYVRAADGQLRSPDGVSSAVCDDAGHGASARDCDRPLHRLRDNGDAADDGVRAADRDDAIHHLPAGRSDELLRSGRRRTNVRSAGMRDGRVRHYGSHDNVLPTRDLCARDLSAGLLRRDVDADDVRNSDVEHDRSFAWNIVRDFVLGPNDCAPLQQGE
jgi:hypothetical protein